MKCRSCGALIVWVVTQNGKRMPVDAQPSEKGNLRIDNGVAYVEPAYEGPKYLSHFATCKQAAQHRKGK